MSTVYIDIEELYDQMPQTSQKASVKYNYYLSFVDDILFFL